MRTRTLSQYPQLCGRLQLFSVALIRCEPESERQLWTIERERYNLIICLEMLYSNEGRRRIGRFEGSFLGCQICV